MSIYSTLTLTETQCIVEIAKHLGVYEVGRDDKGLSKQELLSKILFKITDNNEYSPYYLNNYRVVPDSTQDVP